MATKVCLGCGRLVENATRCPRCEREHNQAKPSSKATQTAAYRKARAAMVEALPLPCWICGQPITTAKAGDEGLEPDHWRGADASDEVRPSHRRCNRRRKAVCKQHPSQLDRHGFGTEGWRIKRQ